MQFFPENVEKTICFPSFYAGQHRVYPRSISRPYVDGATSSSSCTSYCRPWDTFFPCSICTKQISGRNLEYLRLLLGFNLRRISEYYFTSSGYLIHWKVFPKYIYKVRNHSKAIPNRISQFFDTR